MGVHDWGATYPGTGGTEDATLKGNSKIAVNQAPKMSIPDRETSIAAFQGLRA